MYALIDTTNNRVLARHESLKALASLHYIQFANVDALVVKEGENRTWSQLDGKQLLGVALSAGKTIRPDAEYAIKVKLTREAVEQCPWFILPLTLAQLEQQAYSIAPRDSTPYAITMGDGPPDRLKKWTLEPNVNRERGDSSFAVYFASGSASGVHHDERRTSSPAKRVSSTTRKRAQQPTEVTMTTKKTAEEVTTVPKAPPAAKAPSVKAPAKQAATKSAAKKAVPQKAGKDDSRNGVKRPRPGGNCAKVWDACDAVMKGNKCPPFSDVDSRLGESPIPPATRRSNYAVWRKFHGFTGRVS